VDDPYGYRFINVIERHARDSARRVGEAIVNGWREHLNDRLASDDATIVVLKMTGKAGKAHGDDT
jgi:serine phosphatase RsbU (regulator of sigma subunit)